MKLPLTKDFVFMTKQDTVFQDIYDQYPLRNGQIWEGHGFSHSDMQARRKFQVG